MLPAKILVFLLLMILDNKITFWDLQSGPASDILHDVIDNELTEKEFRHFSQILSEIVAGLNECLSIRKQGEKTIQFVFFFSKNVGGVESLGIHISPQLFFQVTRMDL